MPNAEFFTHFGLYVVRQFLGPESCARLRSEVRSAVRVPSTVWRQGEEGVVNESVRRTATARVAEGTVSLVEKRLREIKPALEHHFGVTTMRCERPQFLVYRPGDFFNAHADRSDRTDLSDSVRSRRISVVIFLNGEAEEPGEDSYGGGSLTFHGLWDAPGLERYGFPLVGETGLLIAFRSEVVHAVTPITHGERYTIVSWLER
jgi:SM-20-related protein